MRGGACKAKGGSFERLICKQLSLWVSKGKRDDLLWRSAMSGGRSREAQCGDISTVSAVGAQLTDLFAIECKHYRGSPLLEEVYSTRKSTLSKWWRKLTDEAARFRKLPMLVLRENGRPALVFFCSYGSSAIRSAVPGRVSFPVLRCHGFALNHLLSVMSFEDFCDRVKRATGCPR